MTQQPPPAAGSTSRPSSVPEPSRPGPVPEDSGDGFFRALFDLRFERFLTTAFVVDLYVVAWVFAALVWLLGILCGIVAGLALGTVTYEGETAFAVWPLVVAVLLGWVPSLFAIIALRVVIEVCVATVRTSRNTAELVAHARAEGAQG